MKIDINSERKSEGIYTVTPFGSIDTDNAREFESKLNPLLSTNTKGIVIDLKNVDYISSIGLGVIFSIKKKLKTQSAPLVLCNPKPQIKKVFEVVKALPLDTIFSSVQEADQYLYKIMNDEIEKERLKAKKSF